MDDIPFGAIEIALVFGGVLAWAAWELRKNRRALSEMRNASRPPEPPADRQL